MIASAIFAQETPQMRASKIIKNHSFCNVSLHRTLLEKNSYKRVFKNIKEKDRK